MRSAHRQLIDADLRRCLHAFPDAAPGPVDSRRPGFWSRAWETGVAVAVAHQLDRLSELEGGHRLQAAHAIRSLSALREVLAIFESHGIRAAPLKGPLLGARLYPEYTWRPTTDVDVLVRAADLDAAVEALEAAGGRLGQPYRDNRESHLRFNHHLGVTFRGVEVEIHLRGSHHFGVPLPSEPMLERGQPRELLGLRYLQLDPHDEVIFLAVHAASHLWLRDILLLDLRLLSEREAIDWGEIARRAASLGVGRVVEATLAAAQERVGLSFPGGGQHARVEARLRQLSSSLGVLIAEDTAGALRSLAAEALWVDSPAIAFRFVADRLVFGVKRRLRGRGG